MTTRQAPDYLRDIRNARNLDRIATLIRAQGCRNAAGLMCYTEAGRVAIAVQCEQQASTIERCETITEARRLLRQWSYLPNEEE